MKIKGVSELALWVQDLNASVQFYRDELGFEEVEIDEGRNAFLRSGDLLLVLFNPENPGTKLSEEYIQKHGKPRGSLYHLGLLIERGEIDEFADELKSSGREVRGPVDFPAGRRSYFVEDPDENTIELTDR